MMKLSYDFEMIHNGTVVMILVSILPTDKLMQDKTSNHVMFYSAVNTDTGLQMHASNDTAAHILTTQQQHNW